MTLATSPAERKKKVLILLTAAYPYGEGETFLDNEVPYLASAFGEIVVITNDTDSTQARALPESATCVRQSYELGGVEKLCSLLGILSPVVWQEIYSVLTRIRRWPSARTFATVLVSWQKARKFAKLVRRLARRAGTADVHVYSYWANDMAVAAAVARRNGWVPRAYCRAHGWDVYFDRGYLPFRHFMASNLDRYLFVSEHGRRYFETVMGRSYPSIGCSHLGTPAISSGPRSRLRPFTIVSCSSLIPLKRVELIAQALTHVGSAVRWIHIGEGPSRATVEMQCAAHPAHVKAELPGRYPNAQVLVLYANTQPALFLNVSQTEGLPVSMMEAMSLGIPVMGTDVGGVREIISGGRNGVLLPPDPSAREVAAAIETFAGMGPSQHAAFARQAWETWNAQFNAERNYQQFIQMTQS